MAKQLYKFKGNVNNFHIDTVRINSIYGAHELAHYSTVYESFDNVLFIIGNWCSKPFDCPTEQVMMDAIAYAVAASGSPIRAVTIRELKMDFIDFTPENEETPTYLRVFIKLGELQ